MHRIASFLLYLLGWKLTGNIPQKSKYIIAVAPHTSTFDFVFGRLAATKMRVNTFFLVKKELFIFPLNIILHLCKAIPVDRKAPRAMIDLVAQQIKQKTSFVLVVTPEGTRKKVYHWKKGFYYIAQKSNIPILPAAIDYSKKEIIFGALIDPGNDEKTDFQKMLNFYQNIAPQPKYTEKFAYPKNVG